MKKKTLSAINTSLSNSSRMCYKRKECYVLRYLLGQAVNFFMICIFNRHRFLYNKYFFYRFNNTYVCIRCMYVCV